MIHLQSYQQVSDRISLADINEPWSDTTNEYTIDGRTYTYRCECDEFSSILDEQGEGVWCGRLEWGRVDRETGWQVRPPDFDGGAEKMYTNRNDVMWWQPPEDTRGNKVLRDSLRRSILSVLKDGYIGIIVTDHDGQENSLWRIEPEGADYHREIVRDLITEMHTVWIEQQHFAPDLQRWIASGTK